MLTCNSVKIDTTTCQKEAAIEHGENVTCTSCGELVCKDHLSTYSPTTPTFFEKNVLAANRSLFYCPTCSASRELETISKQLVKSGSAIYHGSLVGSISDLEDALEQLADVLAKLRAATNV